jgi:hypothetical protein
MIKGILNPATDSVVSVYCNVYKEASDALDNDVYYKEYVNNFATIIAK